MPIRDRRPTQQEARSAYKWEVETLSHPARLIGFTSDSEPTFISFKAWKPVADGREHIGSIWYPFDRDGNSVEVSNG